MKKTIPFIVISALLLFSACGDSNKDNTDSTNPVLQTSVAELVHTSQYTFSGTISDNEAVASAQLIFNGVEEDVDINSSGAFSVTKKLNPGSNTYKVIATDTQNNTTQVEGSIYQGYTVAAGGSHSGAIVDGSLYTWGRNNYAQTGLGYNSESDEESLGEHPLAPMKLTMPQTTPLASLSFNQNYSLALDTEGNLWSWGYNKYGELGRGDVDDNCSLTGSSPCSKSPALVDITDVRMVTAGYSHVLALKSDGTLWAWGTNSDGELGNTDANTTQNTPVQVDINESINIVQISAGSDFSMVLDDQGGLWGWGKNNYGQMGLDENHTDDQLTPVQISFPADVKIKSVATGKGHVLALTTENEVYGWGLNASSQIGYYGYQYKEDENNSWNRYEYTPRLVLENNESNPVIEVYANGNSSYIVRADQKIYPWGQFGETVEEDNETKQSYTNLDYPEDKYTQVENIKDVAAGALHIVAIQEDETVFTFKWSFEGSLGGGETTLDKWFYNYPVKPIFSEQ
ncbi:hypothetical protein [Sulfurimonas sp.]|uniref:RCC1 domain-containing protein n=1 Tax=Sulfurimonas sp. TaxID=2022749 RepID=UPI003D12642C